MWVDRAAEIVGVVVFIGGPATYWFVVVRSAARRERAELRERARAVRAHYAAVEAAEDDPGFSPEAIEASVAEIVELVEICWRTGDFSAPNSRPDAILVEAWARARASWLGRDLRVVGKPATDLLGVVNREDEAEDHVVTRVRLRVHCGQPRPGGPSVHRRRLDERWTFGRADRRWVLFSVSGDPLAGPVLEAPLVPTPSADQARLHEESLAELATTDAVDDDVDFSQLVSDDKPAASALRDLSLVDARFQPALIGEELAEVLEAWEWATTGSEARLEQLASALARTALLRPVSGVRLVVRDLVLKSWEPTRLDLKRQPPSVELTLTIEGARHVVRDTGVSVVGNSKDRRRMTLTWIIELTASAKNPWQLVWSNTPAASLPGWP